MAISKALQIERLNEKIEELEETIDELKTSIESLEDDMDDYQDSCDSIASDMLWFFNHQKLNRRRIGIRKRNTGCSKLKEVKKKK